MHLDIYSLNEKCKMLCSECLNLDIEFAEQNLLNVFGRALEIWQKLEAELKK